MSHTTGCMLLSLSALILLCSVLLLLYRRYPLHLIYRSKTDLQDMFDGISDPLVVITEDFIVKRANKAYTILIDKDFSEIIGSNCYQLLRSRTSPCKDCQLKLSMQSHTSKTIERTQHPNKNNTISITFSPCKFTFANKGSVIEHIRDISLLEQLKHDLQAKNHSLAQTMKHLRNAQQNIHDELQLARNIQQGILPTKAPATKGLKLAHTYHPVTDVGGDLYDFIKFSSQRLGVFIGDASGHGLAAAFIGTISKMSLYNHGRIEIDVNELLAKINDDLINNVHSGHYLTCFWGIFDVAAKTFTFSRAGHPMPVQIKKDGTIIQLKSDGTFLGIIPQISFEKCTVSYDIGDRFYLFTDGIYEVDVPGGKNDEMLGCDNFVKVLASCSKTPFSKVMSSIHNQLSGYIYNDDYTLIAIETTAS